MYRSAVFQPGGGISPHQRLLAPPDAGLYQFFIYLSLARISQCIRIFFQLCVRVSRLAQWLEHVQLARVVYTQSRSE